MNLNSCNRVSQQKRAKVLAPDRSRRSPIPSAFTIRRSTTGGIRTASIEACVTPQESVEVAKARRRIRDLETELAP